MKTLIVVTPLVFSSFFFLAAHVKLDKKIQVLGEILGLDFRGFAMMSPIMRLHKYKPFLAEKKMQSL